MTNASGGIISFPYHHLFADLLRHYLSKEHNSLQELHAKAADWHAAHGYPDRAINQYLAAEACERAADLIATDIDAVLKRGENLTLRRWVRRLPEEVIFRRPELCLNCAWALALSGDVDQAEVFLPVAEEAADEGGASL